MLKIHDQENDVTNEEEDEQHYCKCCSNKYNNKYKLAAHYRANKDCRIYYLLDRNAMIPCTNHNCNTWWGNKMS